MSILTDRLKSDMLGVVNGPAGSSAIYTCGTDITAIQVVFQSPYSGPSMGDSIIDSTRPIAICRTVDVPDGAQGDTLVIDDVTYTVTDVQPDGNGITVLELKA